MKRQKITLMLYWYTVLFSYLRVPRFYKGELQGADSDGFVYGMCLQLVINRLPVAGMEVYFYNGWVNLSCSHRDPELCL